MNKKNRELLNLLEELTKFADYKLSQINSDIVYSGAHRTPILVFSGQ